MVDESIYPENRAPEPAPLDAPAEAAPVEAVADATPPDAMPVDAAPAPEPLMVEDVPEEPPADPIITDPVLPDEPADPVFAVPLSLLDPGAVVALQAMADDEKATIKAAIDGAVNYWGEYQHFECPVPGCTRDFLSYADMVSHRVAEHRPEDLDAPAGTQAVYDRFENFIEYREAT